MGKTTQYKSRSSDENGIIHWSDEENQIWSELYARQIELIQGRACQQYLDGLELVDCLKMKSRSYQISIKY